MDLGKVDIFKTLNEKEVERLMLFTQRRKVKTRETIFNEWEEANSLYIVETWILEVIKWKKVLWKVEKWWLIWEMAIFQEKHKRTATVIALVDSELLVISSYAIEKMSKEHKEIYKKIEKIIKKRQKENKI